MILFLTGSGLPAGAQSVDPAPADPAPADPAANASVRLGPIALSPSMRLTNVGYDSNIYGSEFPESDLTAAASPSANLWLRLPVVRLSAQGQLDFLYYHRLTNLRAVDGTTAARMEVPLRMFTPYVAASRTVTRNRLNLEIDAPVERFDGMAMAGADVRLTGKMTVGVNAWRSRHQFSGETLYQGNDLAFLMNRHAEGESAKVRYALTPLTSVGMTAERQRDRYDGAFGRDADSLWLLPEVEFQPLALVSGRAQVGFRKRSLRSGLARDFQGTAARVDLRYTLLGRTVFDVGVQRDLNYSYRTDFEEYVVTGARVAVTHRLSEPWDVGFNVSRSGLDYPVLYPFLEGDPSNLAEPSLRLSETYFGFGGEVGYRVGRTRLGVQADYYKRKTEVLAHRQYDRLRVTSFLSHDF